MWSWPRALTFLCTATCQAQHNSQFCECFTAEALQAADSDGGAHRLWSGCYLRSRGLWGGQWSLACPAPCRRCDARGKWSCWGHLPPPCRHHGSSQPGKKAVDLYSNCISIQGPSFWKFSAIATIKWVICNFQMLNRGLSAIDCKWPLQEPKMSL